MLCHDNTLAKDTCVGRRSRQILAGTHICSLDVQDTHQQRSMQATEELTFKVQHLHTEKTEGIKNPVDLIAQHDKHQILPSVVSKELVTEYIY